MQCDSLCAQAVIAPDTLRVLWKDYPVSMFPAFCKLLEKFEVWVKVKVVLASLPPRPPLFLDGLGLGGDGVVCVRAWVCLYVRVCVVVWVRRCVSKYVRVSIGG
jgi:hypothetical protein